MRDRVGLRLLVVLLGLCGSSAHADFKFGLKTRLGEMWLSGLNVGETYNLRILKNTPYIVENQGDTDVDVEVSVAQPVSAALHEGYEPIPDPNWVNVVPKKFAIPFAGSSYGEIILSIPNDPRWRNRHYQATIRVATSGTGLVSAGVGTKLMFSTGPAPVTKKAQVQIPEFELDPPVLTLFNFPVGVKVNVEKDMRRVLRIVNKSSAKYKMGFELVPFGEVRLPGGYEQAPSTVTFSLSAKTLKMKPDTIAKLGFTVELPPDAHGKSYAFLVKGDLKDYPIAVMSFFTVLVQAEKKSQ